MKIVWERVKEVSKLNILTQKQYEKTSKSSFSLKICYTFFIYIFNIYNKIKFQNIYHPTFWPTSCSFLRNYTKFFGCGTVLFFSGHRYFTSSHMGEHCWIVSSIMAIGVLEFVLSNNCMYHKRSFY